MSVHRHQAGSWRRAAEGIAEDAEELHVLTEQILARMTAARLSDPTDATRSGQALAEVAEAQRGRLRRIEAQMCQRLGDASTRMLDAARERDATESTALDLVGRLHADLRDHVLEAPPTARARPERAGVDSGPDAAGEAD